MIQVRLKIQKRSRSNSSKCWLVMLEVLYGSERALVSTDVWLSETQWNAKNSMVVRHRQSDEINWYLKERIVEIESSAINIWKSGEEISMARLLTRTVSETHSSCGSFTEFMRQEINNSRVRDSTKENHRTTLKHFVNYKESVCHSAVNQELVNGFALHLEEKGMGSNTIKKHLIQLGVYIRKAMAEKLVREHRFTFTHTTGQYKHSWLTSFELAQLESHAEKLWKQRKTITAHIHVLHSFLFCCYTGLRYSDFISLKNENFSSTGSVCWLSFVSKKTGVYVRLPVSLMFGGKALRIWNIYCEAGMDLFKLSSNSYSNKVLSRAGCSLGLEKHISFHTSRHTCATLLLYNKVSVTTIQKLLGHKSMRSTAVYCEVLDETVLKELRDSFPS